ncbi:MAG TPA: cupin domain-containing protein [Polyangia bacterium]|nr:cupin domain-containing protein [Polyangia bacterium]
MTKNGRAAIMSTMSQARRHPNVVHRDEVQPMPMNKGKHRMVLRRLGGAAGGQMIGANLTEVAPGGVSFPFHYHCATEEALYVLSGSGAARIGETRVPVRGGDWISFPVGPEHAHQMINDGVEPLVYLCVSASAQKVDVVGYPDSKKVAATAGTFEKPIHRWISRQGDSVDYWEGEPDAQ